MLDDVAAIAPAFLDPDVGGEAGLPPLTEPELRAFMQDELPGACGRRGFLNPFLIVEHGGDDRRRRHAASLRRCSAAGSRSATGCCRDGTRPRHRAPRAVRTLARPRASSNGVLAARGRRPRRRTNGVDPAVLERLGLHARRPTLRQLLRYRGGRADAHSLYSLLARRMKTLVVYLMAMPDTPELAQAAVEAGADVIELGFPFSDPLADGPVIRRAGERSLAAGMRTGRCLEVLAETRARVDVPLIPMTYASIFDAYGWERLDSDARAAGATSLIVPDLPADVRPELRRVQLVAPTSTDERLRARGRRDRRLALPRHRHRHDRRARGRSPRRSRRWPSARARAHDAAALRRLRHLDARSRRARPPTSSDGVVVGSRAVEAAEQGPPSSRRFVGSLRTALDA